jgi:RNA polymerase sigma factor (sigma-70 family)
LWSAGELGAFFVENRNQFFNHAKRVSRTVPEAEELVQDALVRVLLACPELTSKDHALAYFHRVIENLSVDLHRREGRQPRLVVLDDVSAELESKWRVDDDYAEAIVAADDAAIIREAVALLSPAERAALVMWEIEGRSTEEIARELGVKEVTVRHTLSRARGRLRRILSERIVDEERGLTALDVLSISYRKVAVATKKSSKVALSLVLVISAFLGFNSITPGHLVSSKMQSSIRESENHFERQSGSESRGQLSTEIQPKLRNKLDVPEIQVPNQKSASSPSLLRESVSTLSAIENIGVPTGFTVLDSLGSRGLLFSGQQKSATTESGLLISNIVSTKSDATNVLINQTVIVDAFGTSYVAEASVGINGGWQPLRLSYVSSDVERLASGDYLLTAIMVVDAAVSTAVKVATGSFGVDLEAAPRAIATRMVLDPTKTKILAQAVYISADSQEDEA